MILRDTPGLDSRIQVQFRGSKVYYEQSFREAADEEKRNTSRCVGVRRDGNNRHASSNQFDGKKLRKFNPSTAWKYTEQT